MADLAATYMGIPMAGPVVVAACSLSGRVETIQRIEAAGAGGLVIKSLFEEQIMAEEVQLKKEERVGAERFPESLTYFPPVDHAGAREHLMWIERTRKVVQMPLIGSLNAYTPGGWADYARQIEQTGVNALELNVYAVQTDPDRSGADVEAELFDTVSAVIDQVSIPVSVKLSPFYSSVVNIASELDRRGAKGLVLFNRFIQPDIDPEAEALRNVMDLSRPAEMRLPLRYVALLYGKVDADLAANTGIHTPDAIVRQILAGAAVVEVASVLYAHDVEYIRTLHDGVDRWMDQKGYRKLTDFRGKLSQADAPAPFAYERAQYVELLMQQV
ncbi:MAG: dihydroorotate dehydrogenase-like protein [Planctomycetes bacterium]|nr:dihydroorotate dehydrogenase-like protein [Planctomycetota bacterium]